MVSLAAKDENHLKMLMQLFEERGIKFVVFTEPDFDNQITSITIEPSEMSRKLTSSLPKLMKTIDQLN
jgi:hypothetical protein